MGLGFFLMQFVLMCWLEGLMWSRVKQAGCNPGTWSRPGLGLTQWRPRVEGARLFPDKVPHCDKAINVDSVSQWVKSDAVTDSASVCVHVRMCVSEGSALLRSYQHTMGHVWVGHSGRKKGNIVNGRRHAHHLVLTNKNCDPGPLCAKIRHLQQSTQVTFPVFIWNLQRYKPESSSYTKMKLN